MDKRLHFLAGFAAGLLGAFLCHLAGYPPAIGALAAPVLAGAGKELYDLTGRGTPDWWDFYATCMGAFPAVFLVSV